MLRALDAATGAEVVSFGPDIGSVIAVDASVDGKRVAAVTNAATGPGYRLQLWAANSATPETTLLTSPNLIESVCFSADAKYVAASDQAGSVYVWDVERHVQVARFLNQPAVHALAFSPTGEWLVAGGKQIRLIRVADWTNARTISMPADTQAIVFASGGSQVVVTLSNGDLVWLTVADGKRTRSRNVGSPQSPLMVGISSDGSTIVAANEMGSSIFSSVDGKPLNTIGGRLGGAATAMAFQPSTHIVALAGTDGIVRMYDSQSTRLLKTLDLGGTNIKGLAFSPDGRILIVAGQPRAASASRGVRVAERAAVDFGARHDYAILFATNEYESWPALVNPVPDAETLRDVLEKDYNFEVRVVRNPTREQILSELRSAHQRAFDPADQLMIFFAGHGTYDRELADGYVVAKDSQSGDRNHTSQISYSDLRKNIDSIPAHHILVAMDVCQGGMMLASGARAADEYGRLTLAELLARKINLTTRKLLAAGLDDYVSDGVPGHHSPFVSGLLEKLRSYGGTDGYITSAALYGSLEKVKPGPVMGDWGNNEPGSDFFFIPREMQDQLKNASRPALASRTTALSLAASSNVVVNSPVRRTIAVLPFRNLRGPAPDEYISSQLVEQLWSELNEAPSLRTLDLRVVGQVARDQHWDRPDALTREQLAWAADNLGADLVLSGSYVKADDVVSVNFRVVSTRDNRVVHTFSDNSRESELPSTVLRREGARLRRVVGSGDGTPQPMPAVMPQDRQAGSLYAEALEKIRRNEFAEARDLLEKVVVIEPSFPLAHARLAEMHTSLGYDVKARSESKTAFDLREALGPNEAKLIEGRYYAAQPNWEQARSAMNAVWSYNSDSIDYALEYLQVLIASGQPAQAVKLIEQIKERAPAPEDVLRLEVAEAHAYADMADYPHLKSTADRAVTNAENLHSDPLLAEALWYDAIALRRLGDYAQAIETAGRGLKIVGDGNALLRARLLTAMANAYAARGEDDSALQLRTDALKVARAAEDQRDLAGALTNLANVMIGRSQLDQAAAYYREAIEVATKIEDSLGEGVARFDLASVLSANGDLAGARASLEQSEHLYRTVHNDLRAERANHEIAKLELETGQVKDAHNRLVAVQQAMERAGFSDYLPGVVLSLGDAIAAEGDAKGASEQYERAAALCTKMRNATCTANYRLSAASLLLDQGDAAKAAALARDAAETFKSTKRPDSEVQARVTLAIALFKQGQTQQAIGEVEKAEALHASNRLLNVYLGITASRVRAQLGNQQDAAARLQALVGDAQKMGARMAQLEAELAMVQIGGAASAVSAVTLQKEASDLGYGRIARAAQ
jgi:tetratricopeptide (TPR) repeat protein/TolB-like protein